MKEHLPKDRQELVLESTPQEQTGERAPDSVRQDAECTGGRGRDESGLGMLVYVAVSGAMRPVVYPSLMDVSTLGSAQACFARAQTTARAHFAS